MALDFTVSYHSILTMKILFETVLKIINQHKLYKKYSNS